jgi:hypothetical protein
MTQKQKENIVLIIFRLEGLQRNGFLESQYMRMSDTDLIENLITLFKKHKIFNY